MMTLKRLPLQPGGIFVALLLAAFPPGQAEAACGAGALPSLCRGAAGVHGRRVSPHSPAPLALKVILGRPAARELAGSKD